MSPARIPPCPSKHPRRNEQQNSTWKRNNCILGKMGARWRRGEGEEKTVPRRNCVGDVVEVPVRNDRGVAVYTRSLASSSRPTGRRLPPGAPTSTTSKLRRWRNDLRPLQQQQPRPPLPRGYGPWTSGRSVLPASTRRRTHQRRRCVQCVQRPTPTSCDECARCGRRSPAVESRGVRIQLPHLLKGARLSFRVSSFVGDRSTGACRRVARGAPHLKECQDAVSLCRKLFLVCYIYLPRSRNTRRRWPRESETTTSPSRRIRWRDATSGDLNDPIACKRIRTA